jgi:hypothetical protein
MSKKYLACTCGDCTHWEIIGDAVTPGTTPNDVVLHCKTCGHDFPAKVQVDPHTKLIEIEKEISGAVGI